MGQRSLEPAADNAVRLRLELRAPLSTEQRTAIAEEVALLATHPIDGLVAPRGVKPSRDALVFELEPIHPGAVRLSDLLEGMARDGRALPDGLAAALTATAAQLVHRIHVAPGRLGVPRVHAATHPGALILTPSGTVALVGTGLAHLDSLLHWPDLEAEARQTAPEQALRGATDPRSDIYGLGVLYLTLLAGRRPWPEATAESHRAALAAGRLENPGIAIPDPRPSLVEVLRRAMAPDVGNRYATALAFGQAISNELKQSGRPRGSVEALQGLFEGAIPLDVPRGPDLLVGPPRRHVDRPVRVPKDTPTQPAPPSHDALVQASRPATKDPDRGWSQVLGGGSPAARTPHDPPPRPAPAEPGGDGPSTSLPLPAPPSTDGPSTSLPLPGGAGRDGPSTSLPLPGAGASSDVTASVDLAGGPTSGPTAPSAPAGTTPSLSDASALDALYDADVPSTDSTKAKARTPRIAKPDESSGSPTTPLLIGAGLLVVLLGLWAVLGRGGGTEPVGLEDGAAMGVNSVLDTGVAPTPAPVDAGVPALARAAPDAGARLKPMGFLSVFSKPTGATVVLEGGYVGTTPLVLKHDFEDRVYEVQIMLDGYRKWTKTVRPDPEKKSIHVKALLEKL